MKQLYNLVVSFFRAGERQLLVCRNYMVEWRAIYRKRGLYQDLRYDGSDASKFNEFWSRLGLPKLSNRWHRLYESINGVRDVQYLPDHLYSTQIEWRMNPPRIASVLSDKMLAQNIYSDVNGVTFPKMIAAVTDQLVVDGAGRTLSKEDFKRALEAQGRFVVKPSSGGSSGKGVVLKSYPKQEIAADSMVDKLMQDYPGGFLVQEAIIPHHVLKRLSPKALSTFRVITYVHDGRINTAPSTMRMGLGDSFVDNIHAGGLVIGVSDNGQLAPDAYQLGYCDSTVKFARHPETGVAFVDVRIPRMHDIIAAAIRMHGQTPQLGIISWDMTLAAGGDVMCLEANLYGQSIWFSQICHGVPLFGAHTEAVIRAAFGGRKMGVASKWLL